MEVVLPMEKRLIGLAEDLVRDVAAREGKEETHQTSLRDDDASNDRGLGNKSSSLNLDLDAKFQVQKAGRIVVKSNNGLTKRPEMVNTEFSKSKAGLDVNGICPESASSPATCSFSEKTQLIKQKSSAICRRGQKRSSKGPKNRCELFSLKNDLVGFHMPSGGNDYLGMYGLKPDVFDITKHIEKLSLDELLCGSYKGPNIAIENSREAASSSIDLLEMVRKACLVIEDKRACNSQKCVDNDNNCITKVSVSFVDSSSSTGQTNIENVDTCIPDLPSSDKVEEPIHKMMTLNVADLPLYQPQEILQRLSLPPQKDLDSLLFDAGKTTFSRHFNDPHFVKPVSQRNGLPPLACSHSSSGNSKLAADAAKLSSNRTVCAGKWVKIEKSIALQKTTHDFLLDFESLTFDQSLVPSLTVIPGRPEIEGASADLIFSTSDEHSPEYVAAHTLLDMAIYSKKTPCDTLKVLKEPLQITMKPSKSKLATDRSVKFYDPPRSKKPINPSKIAENGLPLKKLKLSTTILKGGTVYQIESARKGSFHSISSSSVRSHGKLFRDSTTSGRDSYGTELLKKPFL